jgi:hypothetical protein
MEAFLQTAGGDGFMLSPIYCPGAIEEFVDLVVPELQRAGLVRTNIRADHAPQEDDHARRERARDAGMLTLLRAHTQNGYQPRANRMFSEY